MNSCPRCNYPVIYTEGEKRSYECYCGNCICNLDAQERTQYFKHLKDNGLHITRPSNYWLHPSNFIIAENGSDYMPESELELIRIENRKMYHRKYKKAHPDPKTAVKWAKENPEKVKAYQKEYYQKNKEKIKARRNKQYKIDPEPHKKAVRKWKEKNRGLLLNNF